MHYFSFSIKKTLDQLTSKENGISDNEAKKRLEKYGLNENRVNTTPLWKIIIEPFVDIFMLILAIAGVLSIIHKEYLDAGIVFFIMLLNACIFYIQTYSTQKILRTLKSKNSDKAAVIRSGTEKLVDAKYLVLGDIVLAREGDKISADGRLIKTSNFRVDESQLTGESRPVSKQTSVVKPDAAIFERTNMVYQGSFVIGGTAKYIITETGSETEFGKITKLIKKNELISPTQKKIDKLIRQIVLVTVTIAIICFGLSVFRGMDVAEALRFSLTLMVSAVPEGLPIAISVVLVLGMRRMAAKNALVQTMRSIETIGAVNTIATDKTGTLTYNKLNIEKTWQADWSKFDITKACLMSIDEHEDSSSSTDPLDIAIKKQYKIKLNGKPVKSYSFDQELILSGSVWHYGDEYNLFIKGSPESIINKSKLTEKQKETINENLYSFTTKGYRVIALAKSNVNKIPENLNGIVKAKKLDFIGLIAIADKIRPEAKHAIQSAQKAGITVRMITGDHLETAYFIGRKLGLVKNRTQVFDAAQIENISDIELDKIVAKTTVFSRVTPEQKFKILKSLKKSNITAMTGDGVNDVPALSEANVGLSMGSGSHIARDAGDIILLDDNFKTIIDALKEGRTIFSNVKKMLFYLLSTNTGEIMVMLFSLIAGIPLPLVPIQILWVNLVTDTFMVIPLGLEPADKNMMRHKPENKNAPILPKFMIIRMAIMAVTISTLAIASFLYFNKIESLDYARTITFHVLVVTQIAAAFAARNSIESTIVSLKTFNKAFYIGIIATSIPHLAVLLTPLGSYIHLTSVSGLDLIATGLISFSAIMLISEAHKTYCRKTIFKFKS